MNVIATDATRSVPAFPPWSLPRDPPLPGRCENMATATKKFPPASSPQPRAQERAPSPSVFDRFARMIDAIYRFLASLKLAVVLDQLAGGDAGLRDVFRVVVWRGGGAAVHLPQPGVRDPAGVSGDEHPVRGPDPLPVEEAADRVRGHACRALDRCCSARITACEPPTRDRSACSRGT